MTIIRDCPPVFMVTRQCIDHCLSLEAVAVYAYLSYVGPNRDSSHEEIARHFGIALHHIENAVQELRRQGFVGGEDQDLSDLYDVYPDRAVSQPSKRPVIESPGFVYLVKCGPYYKIGRTGNIDRRVGQLGVQMPHPIEIIGKASVSDMIQAERWLHTQYADKRLNGEWFDLDTQDVATILKVFRVGEAAHGRWST